MQDGALEPAEADELAALRRRAYGPGAGALSESARSRLALLEERARGGPGAAPEPSAAVDAPTPDADRPDRETEVAGSDPTVPRVPRVLIAGLMVLVTAALAVTLVAVLFAPGGSFDPRGGTPQPVRTMSADSVEGSEPVGQRELVRSYWGEDPGLLRWYGNLGEVAVWAAHSSRGQSCVFLVHGEAVRGGGCAFDPLEPIVDLPASARLLVEGDLTVPPRGQIRLVAHADRIDVFVAGPAGDRHNGEDDLQSGSLG